MDGPLIMATKVGKRTASPVDEALSLGLDEPLLEKQRLDDPIEKEHGAVTRSDTNEVATTTTEPPASDTKEEEELRGIETMGDLSSSELEDRPMLVLLNNKLERIDENEDMQSEDKQARHDEEVDEPPKGIPGAGDAQERSTVEENHNDHASAVNRDLTSKLNHDIVPPSVEDASKSGRGKRPRSRTNSSVSTSAFVPAAAELRSLSLLSKVCLLLLPLALYHLIVVPLLLGPLSKSETSRAFVHSSAESSPVVTWARQTLMDTVLQLVKPLESEWEMRPGMFDFLFKSITRPPLPRFMTRYPFITGPLALFFLFSFLSFLSEIFIDSPRSQQPNLLQRKRSSWRWWRSVPARLALDLTAWLCVVESLAFQGSIRTLFGRVLTEVALICFLASQLLAASVAIEEEEDELGLDTTGSKKKTRKALVQRKTAFAELLKGVILLSLAVHVILDEQVILSLGFALPFEDKQRNIALALLCGLTWARISYGVLLPFMYAWLSKPTNPIARRMENQDAMRLLAVGVALIFYVSNDQLTLALFLAIAGLSIEPRSLSTWFASLMVINRDVLVRWIFLPLWFLGICVAQTTSDSARMEAWVLTVLFFWFDQLFALRNGGIVIPVVRALVVFACGLWKLWDLHEAQLVELFNVVTTLKKATIASDIKVAEDVGRLLRNESFVGPWMCFVIGFLPAVTIALWRHPSLVSMAKAVLAVTVMLTTVRIGLVDLFPFLNAGVPQNQQKMDKDVLYLLLRSAFVAKTLWYLAWTRLTTSRWVVWFMGGLVWDMAAFTLSVWSGNEAMCILFGIPLFLSSGIALVRMTGLRVTVALALPLVILVLLLEKNNYDELPVAVRDQLPVNGKLYWERLQGQRMKTENIIKGQLPNVATLIGCYTAFVIVVELSQWRPSRTLGSIDLGRMYFYCRLLLRALQGVGLVVLSAWYATQVWFALEKHEWLSSIGPFLAAYATFLSGSFVIVRAALHLRSSRTSWMSRARMSFWVFDVAVDFGMSQVTRRVWKLIKRMSKVCLDVLMLVYRSPTASMALSGVALIELFVVSEFLIGDSLRTSSIAMNGNKDVEVTSAQSMSMTWLMFQLQVVRERVEELVHSSLVWVGDVVASAHQDMPRTKRMEVVALSPLTPFAVYLMLAMAGKLYAFLVSRTDSVIHLVFKWRTLVTPFGLFCLLFGGLQAPLAVVIAVPLAYFLGSATFRMYEWKERNKAKSEFKDWMEHSGKVFAQRRSRELSNQLTDCCQVCCKEIVDVESDDSEDDVKSEDLFHPGVEAHLEMNCCGTLVHLNCFEDWMIINQRCPKCFHPQEFPLNVLNAVL